MGIPALGLTVYVNICIIYATLSVSYYLLSRNEAFSFAASYGKRIIFGLVGGTISLIFQQQNGFLLSGLPDGSFAVLPVILTTTIGGWASGLASMIISIINVDGSYYYKMSIVLILLTLFPFKIWRSTSLKTVLLIIFIIFLYQDVALYFEDNRPHNVYTQLVYPLLECFCFLIIYYALMAQKIYIQDNILIKDFAMIDSVTQLNNRKRVDQEISRLASKKSTFGVVLIDLDDFKRVNDHYGHLVGDQLLFEIADVFRSTTRAMDFVGRYGGEEFIMFIRHQDPAAVLLVCQRIRQAVNKKQFLQKSPQPFKITVSIGISMHYADTDIMKSIHLADLALYKAKEQGKNAVVMSNALAAAADFSH